MQLLLLSYYLNKEKTKAESSSPSTFVPEEADLDAPRPEPGTEYEPWLGEDTALKVLAHLFLRPAELAELQALFGA